MANQTILRLANGADVTVKLGVSETIGKLAGGGDFVELPGEEGILHVRPSGVIAVLEQADRKSSGFRVASAG
jgi:hypothetical protein